VGPLISGVCLDIRVQFIRSLRSCGVWHKTNTAHASSRDQDVWSGRRPWFPTPLDCNWVIRLCGHEIDERFISQDQRQGCPRGNGALVLRFALPSLPASYFDRRVLSPRPPIRTSFSGVGADASKTPSSRAREYSAAGLLSESGPLLRAARSPRFVDLQGLSLYCATRASRSSRTLFLTAAEMV